jgi:hypothetical protein
MNKYNSIPVKWSWYFLNLDQTKEVLQVREADQVTREKWEIANSKAPTGQLKQQKAANPSDLPMMNVLINFAQQNNN